MRLKTNAKPVGQSYTVRNIRSVTDEKGEFRQK
jgi:hypothetical protein